MTDVACPYIERGKKNGPPVLFMSGFPDTEMSAWGTAIPEYFEKSHRCIYMCLPGYSTVDSSNLRKPWGYETEEVLSMMNNTITATGLQEQKFIMVAHDWGAFYTLMYTTRYPDTLSKLILCDIGLGKVESFPAKFIPFLVFYQLLFAVLYWLSQTVSLKVAEWLFITIGIKAFFNFLSPQQMNRMEVPKDHLTVRKCYPYYYLWRRLLTGTMLPQEFPTCPLLFIHGTQKRVIYHDRDFLAQIDRTPGCAHRSLPAGHWFMVDQPEATVRLMAEFLEGGK